MTAHDTASSTRDVHLGIAIFFGGGDSPIDITAVNSHDYRLIAMEIHSNSRIRVPEKTPLYNRLNPQIITL